MIQSLTMADMDATIDVFKKIIAPEPNIKSKELMRIELELPEIIWRSF